MPTALWKYHALGLKMVTYNRLLSYRKTYTTNLCLNVVEVETTQQRPILHIDKHCICNWKCRELYKITWMDAKHLPLSQRNEKLLFMCTSDTVIWRWTSSLNHFNSALRSAPKWPRKTAVQYTGDIYSEND